MSNYSRGFKDTYGPQSSVGGSVANTNNSTTHRITKSQVRAQSKYKYGKANSEYEANYKFKVDPQFAPPPKKVEVLKAYDRRPAGSKLYQGIPGKAVANRKNSKHDSIFKMPASLGGPKHSAENPFSATSGRRKASKPPRSNFNKIMKPT